MWEACDWDGDGDEARLERDPCDTGARERPRRADRLLSLPVFFKSTLAGARRPPERWRAWRRWYCSCSCFWRLRSSMCLASRFSCLCFGGGVGGTLLVFCWRCPAPSWELTLSVLLLLEDSCPALALLVELLVEADEAVESSLNEPRPRGGRCRSTGPYNSRPSEFRNTPPTTVATTPPGGTEADLGAGLMGEEGDSMGDLDEVRGGGGGGKRCGSPLMLPLGDDRPDPAEALEATLRRCSSRGGGRGAWLLLPAALGSVLDTPGNTEAGVLTGDDWESELGKDGSRLTPVFVVLRAEVTVRLVGAAVASGVAGVTSMLLLRLPASDGGLAKVCNSSNRASSAFSARRRGCPSGPTPAGAM